MANISDAEWVLLDLLWTKGPFTIMQIVKLLETSKHWSKHAVISFLNKMEMKGLVASHVEERAKIYSPLIDKTDTAVKESVSFIDKVFHGNMGVMVSNLVEQDKLSDEEIEELMDILSRKKER